MGTVAGLTGSFGSGRLAALHAGSEPVRIGRTGGGYEHTGDPGLDRAFLLMSVSPGEVLIADRYEVGDLLGQGGMADVFDGIDHRLDRPVAIKRLRPDMAARDDVRLRFETEARTAAMLCHPNAVSVFDTGEFNGIPYIVMERLPGETLADRMAAGPVDPDWLRSVALQVLDALARGPRRRHRPS